MSNGVTIEDLPDHVKLEEEAKKVSKQDYTPEQRIKHQSNIINAMNKACEELHNKLNAACVENALLGEQRDRAVENMEKQMTTLQHAMDQHAAKEKSLVKEIIVLRKRMRDNGVNPDKD